MLDQGNRSNMPARAGRHGYGPCLSRRRGSSVAAAPVVAAALRNNDNSGGYEDYGGGASYDLGSGKSEPSLDRRRPVSPPLDRSRTRIGGTKPSRRPSRWQANRPRETLTPLAPASFSRNSIISPKPPWTSSSGRLCCRGRRFSRGGRKIEAPYRRSPPALSVPTAGDYYAMVKTMEEMEDMLEGLLQESPVETDEYDEAKAFLHTIEQQARERSESGGTSSKLKS